MNDLAEKIEKAVADGMAEQRAELTALLDTVRAGVSALEQAVGARPGGTGRTGKRRAPSAPGRPRPKAKPAAASQAASPKKPVARKRRERTAAERAAISERMTAYWKRKREEKAGGT